LIALNSWNFKEHPVQNRIHYLSTATVMSLGILALSACGHTIEQKAATGAIAGAVVAGPAGAAVGGAAGAAVGQVQKPD
jgi:outer membrane lipoprotein SlyB